MKRNQINLSINREDYEKYETYFHWLRLMIIFIGIIFISVFLYFFVNIFRQNNQYENLSVRKKTLLEDLKSKRGDEAKVFYLQKKYSDLETFLKEDSYSAPYYEILSEALKQSSQSSELKSFTVNKKRETAFTVTFASFPELLSFFKFAESDLFLKKFDSISLKTFSFVGAEDNSQNYELSFTGKFTEI